MSDMNTTEPVFNIEEKSVLWMIGLLIAVHGFMYYLQYDLSVYLQFANLPWGFNNIAVSKFRLAYGTVTSAFFHSGFDHLVMNCASLLIFGLIVFRGVRARFGPGTKGTVIFWTIYFAGVVLGSMAQWLRWSMMDVESTYGIGASTGVSALFAAAGWVIGGWPRLGQYTLAFIALNLLMVFFMPQIGWAAHAGGFVAGALLAIYCLKPFSAGTSVLR